MSRKIKDLAALSVNKSAFPYVEKLIDNSEYYKVKLQKIHNATVIDCGIDAEGGWAAGLVFASVCLGGLAKVSMRWNKFDDLFLPAIEVHTDHPVIACMGSQYAGWSVEKGNYFAIGSGPIRSIMRKEEIFDKLDFVDNSEIAILCLETDTIPTEETVLWIAEKSGCLPENIYILLAPTASCVGSIQIAARSVETGLHKMLELGYDINHIKNGLGIAPVPLLCNKDSVALGRTNDAILYGTTVHYNVDDQENDIKILAKKIPSSASKDYGTLFQELMKKYNNKFYDIDPLLFSPAEVYLTHEQSGRSYKAGKIRHDLLRKSFQLVD